MLDRLAERLPQLLLGQTRGRVQQGIAGIAAGGRGQAQHARGRAVEVSEAHQEEIAQAPRELAAAVAGRGQELLGEEGVAFGAGDDGGGQVPGHGAAGTSHEQPRQLLPPERPELKQDRGPRAPDTLGKTAHALGRGCPALGGADGPKQQDRPVAEVVGEEGDEVKRRRVGPVQVLKDEQQGPGGRAFGEERQRRLEHPQLRALRRCPGFPWIPERPQGVDERLVGELRADEVDRAPEEDLEPRVAGTAGHFGRERVLPMPASPATRAVAPAPDRAASRARSSSSSSRARPTNRSPGRAFIPAVSRKRPGPEDTHAGGCG